MSTSPHSLSFSPSVQQSLAGTPKRNSLGSQLPLPTTLNASSSHRPPVGVTVSNMARPNSPTHTRGLSAASGSTRIAGDFHRPNSPPIPTFATSPPAHTSSTHAGGIQPPASFFRPSRPNYQEQYSRPSSDLSMNNGLQQHSTEPDMFQLSPMTNHHPNSSEEQMMESIGGHPESMPDDQQFLSLKRIKQSREPLLPVGGRPGGLGGRPSMSRDRSGSNGAMPVSPNRSATGRLVRNSFDRVLNLSRGLSFDSIRRSTSSRNGDQPGDGRPFDSKLSDEEHGTTYNHSPITPRYKRSMSPVHFNGRGLDVRTSRASPLPSDHSPSPDPSFIPTPPNQNPPLSAIPIISSKTGKPVRRYQLHPSRNRFYFRGRLLTGGDSPWAFMASFGLVLGLSGVWFGTTCVWWWHNLSPAVACVGAYLALLTISSMLATATCDPGILPRNLDPDPPYPATSPSDGGNRVPMPRDLKVRSDVVRVKYCPTCKTYRPPRSSHCKMCDNCVDGCDHHCQWVNNCVGRRNYGTFFILLLSATITLILIIVTSALHLFLLTRRENLDFRNALGRGAGSAVAFCLAIAVIWPVAALLSYHMRLLLLNVTTIEQIRNQAHKTLVPGPAPPNPFSHGSWRRNLVAILCRPQGYSWLNASGVATEDKREVNPGVADHGWDMARREASGER
ncbi:DHHC palmitoyltransferase-domain-containing protein [Crucibulum laeve]|uniref:Palmitoyltransferase n=1 Tax=Crucibulum laeve TaxID=68775 RepID=A0A5C3MBM8_9AGAR|nr:DHHC palmitoyltransferase-domain-containing protein [Crucibulum laeve]